MILSVGNQSGAVKRRLVDMGLTPGTVVKVTKIAPLGDPLEVSLRGYELSVRRADALQFEVGPPGPARTNRGRRAVTRPAGPEAVRRQLRDDEHEPLPGDGKGNQTVVFRPGSGGRAENHIKTACGQAFQKSMAHS